MQENYLAKWLNNELSEAELSEFKKTEEFAAYQKIANASSKLKAPEYKADKTYDAIKDKISSEPKVIKLTPYKKFIQVAAAIVIVFGLTYFYLSTTDETVATSYAENATVVLPDDSQVALNVDSKISYNKDWDKERNVSLKGEAFFKVAKGKKFTVETNHGTVTVLGTQFNVENRKDFFEVTCYEGLVSVLYKGKITKLPGGTSLMVINGKENTLEYFKEDAPSWIRNESSFKSIPLKFVLDEFQRQFNVKVSTKNIDANKLFTGTFNNKNMTLALQSISVPSQIKFKLEGNKVLFYAESIE